AVPSSTITNTVTVTSTAVTDPLPANNRRNNPATVGPGSADLELVKTAPSGVQANHELTYTLSVTDRGPSDAAGLSLTDSIPAGTTFVRTNLPANWTCSHTSLAVVCNDSTHLAPGATDTLLIVLLVGNL